MRTNTHDFAELNNHYLLYSSEECLLMWYEEGDEAGWRVARYAYKEFEDPVTTQKPRTPHVGSCQCENARHHAGYTEPLHEYGIKVRRLVEVRTVYGTFKVCTSCLVTCWGVSQQEVDRIVGPVRYVPDLENGKVKQDDEPGLPCPVCGGPTNSPDHPIHLSGGFKSCNCRNCWSSCRSSRTSSNCRKQRSSSRSRKSARTRTRGSRS